MFVESDLAADSKRSNITSGRWDKLRRSLSSFHKEEKGDAVQAILIIFVAVIVLIALINFFFPSVWNQLKTRITTLIAPKS